MSGFGRDIPTMEPGPTRLLTRTHKLTGDRTGFKASIFLHLDYTPRGEIVGLRLAEKGKDGSTLDRLLHAIGDEATAAIKFVQHEAPRQSTPEEKR